ncbi:MAG: glutamate--tRNA ligase [Alphaproteobacteria bacterium]|nr:glutamate--tRNA ligase [Alphaproteobacteria bacterium]
MSVVTRFAPSPTGFLHIGGARTALFNWLFARHHGGRFLLRIEDTDRERSTEAAVAAILDGLRWLALDWDGEAIFQFARMDRHAAVAHALMAKGGAYRCYASPAELQEMRNKAKAEGRSMRYDGRWRDRDPSEAPSGVQPVIRFKAPRAGETVVRDGVQGEVRVANAELDDMVLLRADGTPTYMLSVVVDDHDMDVTHVIRGDDHFTNAFRQTQLYVAIGWTPPHFSHIPLIHGADGAKLSKRHGALGVDAYRDMGFLPAGMRNYLLRLGWSHGDAEVISTEEAIAWFDIDGIGRSPARFDMEKLASVNAHYLRALEDDRLADLLAPFVAARIGRAMTAEDRGLLLAALADLKPRARTLVELAEGALFLFVRRAPDAKAARLLAEADPAKTARMVEALRDAAGWDAHTLEVAVRACAEAVGEKLGALAQPLRAALTGSTASPPVFKVAEILGRAETLARLDAAIEGAGRRPEV